MEKLKSKNKVLLGLSGGVDSTTAALLLKKNGFDVTGYFFDVTGENTEGRDDAQRVADQLEIPLVSDDVSQIFKETVIDNFLSEYSEGRTPNPCVICNPNVKFKKLLENADRIGAYYIATGHYCRIVYDHEKGFYFVRRAANEKKDQTYMLYRLGQDVLSRLIFPLGEFSDKNDIRSIARENRLDNADKKDSQEICFIPEGKSYDDYMKSCGIKDIPGDFVDKEGNILGKHKGISHYTVGQRKGLGIALGKPAFVLRIDRKTNRVIIGSNEDLFSTKVICDDYIFTAADADYWNGKKVSAKIRYSAIPFEAILTIDNKKITATFSEPQRAVTPGQSIVFYDGDKVIGGGFIK